MATIASILEVKIRATIEGLQSVSDLATELADVAKEALNIGDATRGIDELVEGSQEAGSQIEEAFSILGGETSDKLVQDILTIKATLEGLENAGAPFEVLAGAEEEARIALQRLNEELSSPTPSTFINNVETLSQGLEALGAIGDDAAAHISQAFGVLSTRSFGEITEEIQRVKDALEQVKESGASFEEINRASKLAELQILSLGEELEALSVKATPAADALAATLTLSQKGTLIKDELRSISEALETVRTSGLGFREVAAAEELAATKIRSLKDAYKELMEEGRKSAGGIEDAFKTLGGRTTETIRAEIEQINAALASIKDSGAPFEEVGRASELARIRLNKLNEELSDPSSETFADRLRRIRHLLGEAKFGEAAKEVGKLAFSFDALSKFIGVAITGFVAFKAASIIKELVSDVADFAKKSVDIAARVETLGATLTVVGRNAGYTQESLDKAETSVKKLGITSEAARDSLVKMIQAGIRINEVGEGIDKQGQRLTKAGELARAAQDLAVVTGENSSQTLQRLVTNIQQMDTVGLRFLGLTVKREAAEAKFAASLGVTAGALTESQKRQAFLNATLDEARKLSGAYEEALGTLGKKIGSLQRFQDEFTASFGKAFVPAVTVAVDALSKFLEKGQESVEAFSTSSAAAGQMKAAMESLAPAIVGIAEGLLNTGLSILSSIIRLFSTLIDLVSPLLQAFTAINEAINVFGEKIGLAGDGADSLAAKLNPISGLLNGLSILFAGFTDFVSLAFAAASSAVGFLELGMASLIFATAKFLDLIPFMGTAAQKLKEVAKGLQDSSKDNLGFAEETTRALLNGEGAGAKVLKSFTDTGKAVANTKKEVKDLSKQIEELSAKQVGGKGSAEEISAGYAKVKIALDEALKAGRITKTEFGQLTKQLAVVPGTLVEAYATAAAKSGISIQQLNAKVSESVSAGVDQMKEFVRSVATQNKDIVESTQSSLDNVTKDFGLLFSKNIEGVKSFQELQKVNEAFAQSRETISFTEGQVAQAVDLSARKFDELMTAQSKIILTRKDFNEARVSIEEMGEASSEAGREFTISAEEMKKSVQSIALGFIENNSKIANTSKEVSSLIVEIQRFRREGVLSAEKTAFEINKVTDAFIQAKLKAATTKEDFKALSDELIEMGKNGAISGSKLKIALSEISEAATGAKERIKQVSEQTLALAEAGTRAAQTRFEVARSEVEVAKKRVELWVAQNKYALSGTEIDRVGVEVARLDLEVASRQLEVSRLRFKEQSVSVDLLISKQKLLNATTALQHDQGNEALQQVRALAEEEVRKKDIIVNATKEQVNAGERGLIQAQIAQVKTKGLQEIMKTIEEQTNINTQRSGAFNESLSRVNSSASSIGSTLRQAGEQGAVGFDKAGSSLSRVKAGFVNFAPTPNLTDIAAKLGTTIREVGEDYEFAQQQAERSFNAQEGSINDVDFALGNLVAKQNLFDTTDAFGMTRSKSAFDQFGNTVDDVDKKVANAQATLKKGLAPDTVDKTDALKGGIDKLGEGYNELAEGTISWSEKTVKSYEKVGAALDALILKQGKLSNGFSAGGSLPGFATGGPISGAIHGPGTGTSDSILLWGSNGEYMVRERAVSHYGEDFMDMVNNLTLPRDSIPKYASGGLIGSTTNNFTTIVPSRDSGDSETINLDLSLNKKRVGRVQGPRDTIKALVGALREVQGGTQ